MALGGVKYFLMGNLYVNKKRVPNHHTSLITVSLGSFFACVHMHVLYSPNAVARGCSRQNSINPVNLTFCLRGFTHGPVPPDAQKPLTADRHSGQGSYAQ